MDRLPPPLATLLTDVGFTSVVRLEVVVDSLKDAYDLIDELLGHGVDFHSDADILFSFINARRDSARRVRRRIALTAGPELLARVDEIRSSALAAPILHVDVVVLERATAVVANSWRTARQKKLATTESPCARAAAERAELSRW